MNAHFLVSQGSPPQSTPVVTKCIEAKFLEPEALVCATYWLKLLGKQLNEIRLSMSALSEFLLELAGGEPLLLLQESLLAGFELLFEMPNHMSLDTKKRHRSETKTTK